MFQSHIGKSPVGTMEAGVMILVNGLLRHISGAILTTQPPGGKAIVLSPQFRTARPAKAGFLMQRSPEAQAYHRWYKRKLWCHVPTGLRWQCLVKALFRCQQPGCGWQAKASETHLLVADHRIPHRGDWALFIDQDNLRCICKPCHDAAKQSEDILGYSKEISSDGWPIDPRHPGAS